MGPFTILYIIIAAVLLIAAWLFLRRPKPCPQCRSKKTVLSREKRTLNERYQLITYGMCRDCGHIWTVEERWNASSSLQP